MPVEPVQPTTPTPANPPSPAPSGNPQKAPETTPAPQAAPPAVPAKGEEAPKGERNGLAERFAVLSKREMALQRAARELKAQEAEYRKAAAQLEEINQVRAMAKQDPIAFLEKFGGLTYEEVTQFLLNDRKPTPALEAKAVRDEVQRLREELEERERSRQEAAERRALEEQERRQEETEQTIRQWKEELSGFVKQQKDDYELINLYGEYDLVADTVEAYHQRTGKVLTNKEAADVVEAHLAEAAEKAIASKKLSARYQKVEKKEDQRQPGSAQPRTVTTDLTANLPAVSEQRQRSEDDRMARALAALEGRKT